MIPNMDDLTPIKIDALVLVPYTTNVQIFSSTPAREIPSKLNAVAVDFKDWNNNEIGTKGKNYLNAGIEDVANYINASMTTVVSFINTIVVANQNDFTNTMNSNWTTYQNDLNSNLGNYLNNHDAGYSIEQVNSLEFTGNSSIEYDSEGRIMKRVEGAKEVNSITYNATNQITGFVEKIVINGITYSKNYEVTYDTNQNPIISEV